MATPAAVEGLRDAAASEIERADAAFAVDFAVLSLMRAGHCRLRDRLERKLAGSELTPAQFELLVLVRQDPEANQGELAEALSINRATIVGWVDRLVADGLLIRSISAADRRVRKLRLTAKGKRRLSSFERRLDEALQPFRTGLGPAGYSKFVELLSLFDGAGRTPDRMPRPSFPDRELSATSET